MKTVQNDINQFNELHPNRKLAVFGIILFVFVLSIVVGIYFAKKSSGPTTDTGTPLPTSPANTVATTSLAIVPSAQTVKVGEKVTVSIMLDGEAVQASDVVVKFDPAVFVASDIKNGSVYDTVVRQTVGKDSVSFTGAVSPTSVDSLKTGEVVTFTLEAIAKGSSELSFDPELTMTAKNGLNTLKGTQNVMLTVE